MKKLLVLLLSGLLTGFSFVSFGQDPNILTGLDGPAFGVKIKVNYPGLNSGWSRGFTIVNEDNAQKFFGLGAKGEIIDGASQMNYGWIGRAYDDAFMYFNSNGFVGVNTKTPIGVLHVKMQNNNTAQGFTLESYNGSSQWHILAEATTGTEWGDRPLLFYSKQSGYIMSLDGNGNVGIGKTNPQNKLDVNGTIRAKEVKVEANWADFVFEEDYDLRSLSEVETFIQKNQHLPEIPSEEEVKTNGISVGEMNAKLLQKIEELTLYVIEQNRQNQKQATEIQSLKKENLELMKLKEEFRRMKALLNKDNK
jgi:hypothetical protein